MMKKEIWGWVEDALIFSVIAALCGWLVIALLEVLS